MLKPRIRTARPATTKRETPQHKLPRHITRRRFGKKAVALAVAPIVAAAVTLTGVAITAPSASAATGCVTQTFGTWDENTYEQCVRDEQVLLNDLWYWGNEHGFPNGYVNQLLTVDGYYGSHRFSDVWYFQTKMGIKVDGITGPQTWQFVCDDDYANGFTGTYWHDAGCNTEPGL